MGDIVFLLARGAIYYWSQLQPTVAQSSTEAEFCNMTDGRKSALYLFSILREIGINQTLPAEILAGNRGAQHLSKARQPTRCTRHVDMKHFVII
jgi:hypothetical protein